MNYFFLKSVKKGSANKLVPLKGQTLFSEPVDTSLNVAGSRSVREAYPIGTVFGTPCLSFCGTHYSASQLYPISVSFADLKDAGHQPPVDMVTEYNRYLLEGGSSDTDFDEIPAAAAAAPLFGREMGLFDEDPIAETGKSAPKTARAPKPAKPAAPAVTLLEEIKRDFATPTVSDCGFYVDEKNWRLLIRNIRRKVNTMLTGPTGTGKTELIRLIGEKLGLEVSVFDMGSMFDPTVQMLGSHRLSAGTSVFDYAPFAKAVQKPGIILLDELSRAPVSTNNLLFPCLDSRRCLPVEQAGATEETKIAVHPDCVFIATANIGSQYTGTQELDAALKNRFFNLELDYMPSEAEVDVLVGRTGVKAADAKNIVRVAGTVRDLYRKGELSTCISTRETLCVASLVADGFSVIEALEMTVLPQFEGTATEGERSVVRSCFMAS